MIGTRAEWVAARGELARQRRELPWVPHLFDLGRTPTGRPSREELGDWPRRHDEYEEAIHAG